MILYIILSVVIILISWGCLRSKFNGYIPISVFSFILAGVLCVIIDTCRFFIEEDKQIYTTESKLYLAKDSIISPKDGIIFTATNNKKYDTAMIKNVVVTDSITGVKKTVTRRDRDMGYFWKIGHETKEVVEYQMSKKNYGIYKAYLDSLEKRNKSLEKNGKNV